MQADINSDSDFPSLSGGPRPTQSSAAAAGWNSNAIRQPSQSSQMPGQQRAPSTAPSQQSLDQFEGQQRAQPQPSERQQSGDEFPPLGGQVNGDAMNQAQSGFTSTLGSPDMQHSRTNGQQTQLPIRDGNGSYAQQQPPQQPPIGPPPPQSQSQQTPAPSNPAPPPSNIKRYEDMTENEKWGIPGLMAAFEARRQMEIGGPVDDSLPPEMRNGIMMGQDLDQLGMDLNQEGPLYTTFTPFPNGNMSGSSYDYRDRYMVPDFHLPAGYTVNNVPPLPSRMSALSDGKYLLNPWRRHFTDIQSQNHSSRSSTSTRATSCKSSPLTSSSAAIGAGTKSCGSGCRRTPRSRIPARRSVSSTSRRASPSACPRVPSASAASAASTSSSSPTTGVARGVSSCSTTTSSRTRSFRAWRRGWGCWAGRSAEVVRWVGKGLVRRRGALKCLVLDAAPRPKPPARERRRTKRDVRAVSGGRCAVCLLAVFPDSAIG